ncbi:hypothetical protein HanIR_Chr07g0308041 [Helianthus annuus]|nr:hypothetical protein HanIR_Chr07g0308041 [Helianthus annuus]
MGLKRLLNQASRQQLQSTLLKNLYTRPYNLSQKVIADAVYKLPNAQRRFQSSYVGSLGRRLRERDADRASDASSFRELYHRNDPEAVIRLFESQPSMHSNPAALKEYVKLWSKLIDWMKVSCSRHCKEEWQASRKPAYDEDMIGSLSALKNVGKSTKEGVLGTAAAPIHMVAN